MTPGPGIFRTNLPKDFYANGINCGVRRYRPDLGVIFSKRDCVAVGVFTQSNCKAAPVKYCQSILPAENVRAVITNSGQANAATGSKGTLDNINMAETLAENLQCQPNQVLTASTGVIGEPMSIDKITQAIPKLVTNYSDVAEKFALAILTTDLVPKTVSKEVVLSNGKVQITGICKGSGMIHPNMATMLGYILTDAKLTISQADALLQNANDHSFNMISVDGETSTNDSVFMLANGSSEVEIINQEDFVIMQNAIQDVAIVLAKSIARDGEGASKLIEVKVKGAASIDLARKIARSLTVSPLIKTAIYGESPNWGRIIARIGMEAIGEQDLEKCKINIQDFCIYPLSNEFATGSAILKEKMQQDTINIEVELNSGDHAATAWGCDLTEKYVQINAEYVT